MRIRLTKPVVLVIAAVLLLGSLIFWGQQRMSDSTFGRLEAQQTAQDAQRIKIALDYEVQLVANYGSTNSIWDSSYADVAKHDRAAFLSDFPPDQMRQLYGIDGVVGTSANGQPLVGGLATAGNQFQPLPADLASPNVLAGLVNLAGKAGQGRCGVVASVTAPFLFCGFPAFNSDGSGSPSGGLIYLVELNAPKLASLGSTIGMPLHLVSAVRPGASSTLSSSLGQIAVSTAPLNGHTMALDVAVPTTAGVPIVIEASRTRAIHAVARSWSIKIFIALVCVLALIVGCVVVAVRRAIARKVGPLRSTTEQIMASGDRSLRINSTDRSEIGSLARAIDSMLDHLADREAALAREHADRERETQELNQRQQAAEAAIRERSEQTVRAAATDVLQELRRVLGEADTVRGAAGTIDAKVEAAGRLTDAAVGQARAAQDVVRNLSESLQQVAGVATFISGVAGQTNLLALNATIEAARAGEAGKGFSVVASEVKELANTTARSTAEISATITQLEQDAAAMSAVMDDVARGIASISEATHEVSEVTVGQRETARALDASVQEAINRVAAISKVG